MVFRPLRTAPLTLLALFVLLSGIPLAALGWLGIRVLQQDRAIEAQRLRERLENAAGLGAAPVAGSPAELIARRERIVLLNAAGRKADVGDERALLESALENGKYRIDRATFEYFNDVLPKGAPVSPMTVAVDAMWAV